jgi:hypothetical protein
MTRYQFTHDDRAGKFETIREVKTMTGANALLASRRFWTLLLDTIISLVLYFAGKYFNAAMEDIRFLIIAIQPIALLLIAAYTVDGVNETRIQIAQVTATAAKQ